MYDQYSEKPFSLEMEKRSDFVGMTTIICDLMPMNKMVTEK